MGLNIIAGRARQVALTVPEGMPVRPTLGRVREALFNSLGPLEGLAVLDLFAGSGALGLEAVSRGAARACLVELESAHVECIRENLRRVVAAGVTARVDICQQDALDCGACFRHLTVRPDLVFADPPYEHSAEFFRQLLADKLFRSYLAGAKLIWEIPDTPGALGTFLGTDWAAGALFRRFGNTGFLLGRL